MPIYQYQFKWENNTFEQSIQLTLKGLRGGHSGCDIHTGRANAIKVMARVLAKLFTKHFSFPACRNSWWFNSKRYS